MTLSMGRPLNNIRKNMIFHFIYCLSLFISISQLEMGFVLTPVRQFGQIDSFAMNAFSVQDCICYTYVIMNREKNIWNSRHNGNQFFEWKKINNTNVNYSRNLLALNSPNGPIITTNEIFLEKERRNKRILEMRKEIKASNIVKKKSSNFAYSKLKM